MSFVSPEVQFAELKREIDQLVLVKDYESLLPTIKKALECCHRVYEEATDIQKKEIMRKNGIYLKKLYGDCQSKLEGEGKVIHTPGSGTDKKPNSKPKKAGEKDGENKDDDNDLGDVEYEFFGVDIRGFLTPESSESVSFTDVKGMEDEKKIIRKEFFASEKQLALRKMTHQENKNFILLYGVPGTGKTFFAKAISTELKKRSEEGKKVPFFSVVGNQLKDSKFGGSEKNILALFEFCKQFDRCVLFIDEFESIVPDRNSEESTSNQTAQITVTTFLQCMDGFNSGKGTLVIAATNCPYKIDGAVLSRANSKIEIPLPSKEVIVSVLEAKIGSLIDENVNLGNVAERLNGFSNRDVKNFVSNLRDALQDKLIVDEENGIDKPLEEYRYTNELINIAISKSQKSTKAEDIYLINKFKESIKA